MRLLGFGIALLSIVLGGSPLARADVVTHWNDVAGRAARAACIAPGADPLHESRIYAMTHLAIHDALNAIDRRFRPYALDIEAPAGRRARRRWPRPRARSWS